MSTPGLVNLRCNGGHVWMNAEMMVVPHPYYAVTDESGRFEFTGVPPERIRLLPGTKAGDWREKSKHMTC